MSWNEISGFDFSNDKEKAAEILLRTLVWAEGQPKVFILQVAQAIGLNSLMLLNVAKRLGVVQKKRSWRKMRAIRWWFPPGTADTPNCIIV